MYLILSYRMPIVSLTNFLQNLMALSVLCVYLVFQSPDALIQGMEARDCLQLLFMSDP